MLRHTLATANANPKRGILLSCIHNPKGPATGMNLSLVMPDVPGIPANATLLMRPLSQAYRAYD
jgi:hypothetical protein